MSSSTKSKMPKAATLAFLQALIAGLQKHFPGGSLTLGGASLSVTSLVQILQDLVSAMLAASAAQANARDAVANVRAKKAAAAPIIKGLRSLLGTMFAGAAQALADFGIEPPKARKPMSSEVLVARAAKAEATRAKRGTKGPKAKLAIKGDVTGVEITPVTSPVALPPAQQEANASSAPTGAAK
jgi:hypothetical protein